MPSARQIGTSRDRHRSRQTDPIRMLHYISDFTPCAAAFLSPSSHQSPQPLLATSRRMSLNEYEKKVRNHALLAGIAFLVVVPIGVLIPRYLRTFTNRSVHLLYHSRTRPRRHSYPLSARRRWWWAHWIINFVVAGALLIASWSEASDANSLSGFPSDDHKVCFSHILFARSYHDFTITRHQTDFWICCLRTVHCSDRGRRVHSFYSHSLPLRRPPTATELYPCAYRTYHPCDGCFSGSSLTSLSLNTYLI